MKPIETKETKARIGCFSKLYAIQSELAEFQNRDFLTRRSLADYVSKNAVTVPIENPKEWYKDVLAYLRKHHDAIVRYDCGFGDAFYFYAKGMTARTMPYIRIMEVDISKYWMIDEEYGDEDIRYLDLLDHKQVTPERVKEREE